MSAHRSRRVDRRTAEHLLAGAPVEAPSALVRLLDAAAAAGSSDELAGEEAVVAAFRAARPATVPPVRSRRVIRTTVARLLTVKVAAMAAGVAVAGVAVAAGTGHLPARFGDTTVAPAISHVIRTAAPVSVTGGATAGGTGRGSSAGSVPSPSMPGLCHAYLAGGGGHSGTVDNPAFAALFAAAGGQGDATAYCDGLLGLSAGMAKPTSPKANPGHVTDGPNPRSTGLPTPHPHPTH
jgi:hypothetical protein